MLTYFLIDVNATSTLINVEVKWVDLKATQLIRLVSELMKYTFVYPCKVYSYTFLSTSESASLDPFALFVSFLYE